MYLLVTTHHRGQEQMCPCAEVKRNKSRVQLFFFNSSIKSVLLIAVNLFVSLNTCSTSATQADISLSGQRCHPEQQEKRTWIYSGLCPSHSRRIQACVQVSGCILTSMLFAPVRKRNINCICHCVSYSETVRRIVENSWAGFCPSGKRELCMTAACWISCRRSFVSSRSAQAPTISSVSDRFSQWGSVNVFLPIDGEKKAKKRQYEEIQPDVEDFASQSSPAEPPQVLHRKFAVLCWRHTTPPIVWITM